MNKKQQSGSSNMTIGITVAAAAAAAGALFLYGTQKGKTSRKKINGWMLKAKGEVLEKIENLKEVNEEAYHKVVNAVADKYAKVKNIDPQDLAGLITEVRGHWGNIKRQFGAGKKKPAAKKATGAKTATKAKPKATKSAETK